MPEDPLDLLKEWFGLWKGEDYMPPKLPNSLHTRTAVALTTNEFEPRQNVREFLSWLISMDDVEGIGFERRRSVTLNTIIERAKTVMGELDGGQR